MKKTIFLILCILCSLGAMAQKKSITGVVTDASGESVIGASVVEVGTTNGVITDIDGKFTLMVDPNGKIKVSYIGYQSQVLDVKGRNSFNITLKEDSHLVDEVVVVGYGTQKKVNLTGSVEAVSGKDLAKRPVMNTMSALQGMASGVTVTSTSGQPGKEDESIMIRGIGTLNNSNPLVLIDGVASSVNAVNPQDIESISQFTAHVLQTVWY